jgi:Fis family transcriptional regulator
MSAGGAPPLRECVREAVESYFTHLDGHSCNGLYKLVMQEVEAPLFEVVLEVAKHNQSAAAEILGMSRGTLRKKLRDYELI